MVENIVILIPCTDTSQCEEGLVCIAGICPTNDCHHPIGACAEWGVYDSIVCNSEGCEGK
jgi:hypothetical protein